MTSSYKHHLNTPKYPKGESTLYRSYAVVNSCYSSFPDPQKPLLALASSFQEPKTWLPVSFRAGHWPPPINCTANQLCQPVPFWTSQKMWGNSLILIDLFVQRSEILFVSLSFNKKCKESNFEVQLKVARTWHSKIITPRQIPSGWTTDSWFWGSIWNFKCNRELQNLRLLRGVSWGSNPSNSVHSLIYPKVPNTAKCAVF